MIFFLVDTSHYSRFRAVKQIFCIEGLFAMHNDAPLFRAEVINSKRIRNVGEISLAQPISWRIAALVTVILSTAIVILVIYGSVAKKSKVSGVLVPATGSLLLSAPTAGVLIDSHIREGDSVRFGQALFVISNEKVGDQGELTSLVTKQLELRRIALVNQRKARLAQDVDKRTELKEKLDNFSVEQGRLEREVILARRRLELAEISTKKYQNLQEKGFVSAEQTQQKQEDQLDAAGRLSSLERDQVQVSASTLGIRAELRGLSSHLAGEIALMDDAMATLGQQILENQNGRVTIVKAPRAGIITTIVQSTGQAIGAGQLLGTLIPFQQGAAAVPNLEAHLFVPSRSVGFIAPGQTVFLRYHAYSYELFGLQKGVIVDVSRTPLSAGELPTNLSGTISSQMEQNGQSSGGEALFRVTVRLNRQVISANAVSYKLKPGMTFDADVVQDSRKIWQWLFQPITAMSL